MLGILPPPIYILSRFDVFLKLKMEALFSSVAVVIQTRAQVCPLKDLFRTNHGVKSTQVRSVREPDITDL